MKSNQLNLFLLISMFILVMAMVSCDKNEVQRTEGQPDSTTAVTNRTIDDCEDCPVDYCCCAVEVINPSDIYDLLFCGVYTNMTGSPCGPFSPGSPCGTISGISSLFQLSSLNTRALFCVPTGGSFRILKTSGSGVTLRIACDLEQVNPTWFPFNIDGSPVYYYVNDCDDLDGC
jgi:hypothetical protein